MFFSKKKEENVITSFFEEIEMHIDSDKGLQQSMKEEEDLMYKETLLDWFYTANKMAIALKHLELMPDNPRSAHTLKTKGRREGEVAELSEILTHNANRLIELKGQEYKEGKLLVSEVSKIFLGK